jgi:hypothetical protein
MMGGLNSILLLICLKFIQINSSELSVIASLLNERGESKNYVHMIEYGRSDSILSTISFSRHEAIVSWSLVTDDPREAEDVRNQYDGSRRVSVKAVQGKFALWNGKKYDDKSEEGTQSEYESYISELMYFGSKDNYPYWMANFGRARVDVAIAALPLLSRTGGLMFISDWTTNECFAETLLQFYILVDVKANMAVLAPKDPAALEDIGNNGHFFNWCFSWQDGRKIIRYSNGPSDTNSVVGIVQSDTIGCRDIFGDLNCDEDGSNCLSCYAVMTSITKRGSSVRGSIKKVVTAISNGLNEL